VLDELWQWIGKINSESVYGDDEAIPSVMRGGEKILYNQGGMARKAASEVVMARWTERRERIRYDRA
jgi:hypothetical protein